MGPRHLTWEAHGDQATTPLSAGTTATTPAPARPLPCRLHAGLRVELLRRRGHHAGTSAPGALYGRLRDGHRGELLVRPLVGDPARAG